MLHPLRAAGGVYAEIVHELLKMAVEPTRSPARRRARAPPVHGHAGLTRTGPLGIACHVRKALKVPQGNFTGLRFLL